MQSPDGLPTASYVNAAPTSIVLDLGAGQAYTPGYNSPPAPVVTAFGCGPMHECRSNGEFDLARAVEENRERLIRSYRDIQAEENTTHWQDVIFQYGPQSFVCADEKFVSAYAATCEEAKALVDEFRKAYCGLNPEKGVFYLIKRQESDISTEKVELPENSLLTPEQLALHYYDGMPEWHCHFVENLKKRPYGLSILEGEPGTGKTSYLRHLATELRHTHRFYFIPPLDLEILSQHTFVAFWANQRRYHGSKNFVVILEDADTALMRRGTDNREQVSTILNLSDGLLGDFLRLQIICTINGSSEEIDPALLRPGRLTGHRFFRRLPHEQAVRVAASIGKTLKAERSYTLAEIFNDEFCSRKEPRRIGFAPLV